MVSVPKKIFKRSVDRNLIKRKIREAVRHKKYILEENPTASNKKHIFAITYLGKSIPETSDIFETVEYLFETWKARHENN